MIFINASPQSQTHPSSGIEDQQEISHQLNENIGDYNDSDYQGQPHARDTHDYDENDSMYIKRAYNPNISLDNYEADNANDLSYQQRSQPINRYQGYSRQSYDNYDSTYKPLSRYSAPTTRPQQKANYPYKYDDYEANNSAEKPYGSFNDSDYETHFPGSEYSSKDVELDGQQRHHNHEIEKIVKPLPSSSSSSSASSSGTFSSSASSSASSNGGVSRSSSSSNDGVSAAESWGGKV